MMNLMNKLLLISILSLLIDLCSCGSKRVIGGREVKNDEVPFIVYLRIYMEDPPDEQSRISHCGGSILNEQWILTAAHCIMGVINNGMYPTIEVHPGISAIYQKKIGYQLASIHTHPNYLNTYVDDESNSMENGLKKYIVNENSTIKNDIALLKLSGKLKFSRTINKIFLPRPKEEKSYSKAEVIGYGIRNASYESMLSDNFMILMLAQVDIFDDDDPICFNKGKVLDSSMMICAGFKPGGKDSCRGDSGGPLYIRRSNRTPVVLGVVSFGDDACGSPNIASFYTRVSSFLDWIESTMSEN